MGAVSTGTESLGVAMSGRKKSRMDHVCEKESPNFEETETKKSENKRYCEPKKKKGERKNLIFPRIIYAYLHII